MWSRIMCETVNNAGNKSYTVLVFILKLIHALEEYLQLHNNARAWVCLASTQPYKQICKTQCVATLIY